jgi:acyl carrier protein
MTITIEDITPIFKEIFENNELKISTSTIAKDIEEWDSLNHIYLVVAIEKRFGKKFTAKQIQQWSCVGDVLKDLNNL